MAESGLPEETETKLLGILEAIRSLTPKQRRRLQRRLRISGLLGPEEYVADRDRLRVAPALHSASHSSTSRSSISADNDVTDSEEPFVRTAGVSTSPGAPAEPDADSLNQHPAASDDEPAVATDVALEDGESDAEEAKDAALQPAPSESIGLVFDGGSRGEQAKGFGSYAIRWPGLPQEIVQLRFGDNVSEQEAAYDTLISALEAVQQRLLDNSFDARTAKLDIRGDSDEIIGQVTGQTEIENPSLQVRCDRVRYLLRDFQSWDIAKHHPDT